MRHLVAAAAIAQGSPADEASFAYEEDSAPGVDEPSTKDLRIVAVFVVFVAGLIGSLPPLFIKVFREPGSIVTRLLRAMSAGIILALAVIHIIPDAYSHLGQLADLTNPSYDVSGCTVFFGVAIMIIIESLVHSFIERNKAPSSSVTDPNNNNLSVAPSCAPCGVPVSPEAHGTIELHHHHHHYQEQCPPSPSKEAAAPVAGEGAVTIPMAATSTVGQLVDPHGHMCMGTGVLSLEVVHIGTVRDQVMALLFELGCIFHSFIIGLTLGVEQDDRPEVRALLIALCFHQGLEGVTLGSFVVNAGGSIWKGISMVVIYSLTCPLGTAVGIGIAETYNPDSLKAIATQGVLNGVSGGILLYIALVQLVAEDFSRREVTGRKQPAWLQPACYAALVVGGGLMAIIAIWA